MWFLLSGLLLPNSLCFHVPLPPEQLDDGSNLIGAPTRVFSGQPIIVIFEKFPVLLLFSADFEARFCDCLGLSLQFDLTMSFHQRSVHSLFFNFICFFLPYFFLLHSNLLEDLFLVCLGCGWMVLFGSVQWCRILLDFFINIELF